MVGTPTAEFTVLVSASTGTLPRRVMLLGFFLALMRIKLAEQVMLNSNSITIISGRSKEFALALRAASHCGNFVFVSQNDKAALCHGTQCGTVVVAFTSDLSCRREWQLPLEDRLDPPKRQRTLTASPLVRISEQSRKRAPHNAVIFAFY